MPITTSWENGAFRRLCQNYLSNRCFITFFIRKFFSICKLHQIFTSQKGIARKGLLLYLKRIIWYCLQGRDLTVQQLASLLDYNVYPRHVIRSSFHHQYSNTTHSVLSEKLLAWYSLVRNDSFVLRFQ